MRLVPISVGLCLLAGGVPIASADQACRPVVGHFEASIVPPGVEHCPNDPQAFCTAGRVWGGIQGQYQYEAQDSMVPGYVIQQQLDETNQRLVKAQAQQARIEAMVEKRGATKKAPGDPER